jgi:predicted dehydrogenase
MKKIKVLVVGLGNMGLSHARAYQSIKGFEIVGLCTRGIETRADIKTEFPGVRLFADYAEAL